MLTKSLKILDTTKTEAFELIFFQSDQKILQKYYRADLRNIWDPETCWLSINVLTGGFFFFLVNPVFAVYNFRKKSPLRLNFFLEYCKLYVDSVNAAKNWENIFWFWDNCIWIGGVRHSLLVRKNTFHLVLICLQNVRRFQILLKQNFSSWFHFRVIKKYEKNTALQI